MLFTIDNVFKTVALLCLLQNSYLQYKKSKDPNAKVSNFAPIVHMSMKNYLVKEN